jgi:aspartate carbamoyltransferase catalytic subunit
MMLRIQKERLTGVHIDLEEYTTRYQLHSERLRTSAPQAIVMHPGPMIRGLEITSDVADGPQSVIAEQVRNGVAIRMALIHRALVPEPAKTSPQAGPAKKPTVRKSPAAGKGSGA